MTSKHIGEGVGAIFTPARKDRLKRLAVVTGVPLVLGLILFLILWNTFFHYVPPGRMLVIVAKNGEPLRPGQVLADPGQKGIQREVLGEGWHYVTPIIYATEVLDNTVVPAGKVGIVKAEGGVPPRDGRILAEQDDEQGIRRQVLPPGSYRLNPHGYKVELVPATEITAGHVGVVRRRLGKDAAGRFATGPDEKGILPDVLQPGIYYLNTKEYEVLPCEVGIYQTSFHKEVAGRPNTAISFKARDGMTITMDTTVEWEVQPEDWPALVAEHGSLKVVERNVIDQYARKISRDRGLNFGAEDFLEGAKREAFQSDFTQELERACKKNRVEVRSAFIRDIAIPETFLEPKRKRQLAVETEITTVAKTETAKSDADVEEARRMIDQRVAEVGAETARLVAAIDRQRENVKTLNTAEIDKLKADYGARIGQLDAERDQVMGEAKAQAEKLRETAKSSLHKMKMDVFRNDSAAYLRYTMAQELNQKVVLRLFHSGPGTLWTNMGDKHMNLLMPVPGAAPPEGKPVADAKERK
jgi:hypothetical protein